VINLVSTSSKADADRLVKKALSRDIQTQQQQITVKGTQYWRVQITGFSTQEQANAYADIAKDKLGLKAVWIMKR
jgi:osmotically-inducible protein OsmY